MILKLFFIKNFKKEKRSVYSFGCGSDGRLGIGNENNQSTPQLVMEDQSIVSICCSAWNTFIIKSKKNINK